MQTQHLERRALQPGVFDSTEMVLGAQAAGRTIRRFLTITAIALLSLSATAPRVRAEAIDPGAKAPTVEEPADYRHDEYRKPVPATLKGAKVVSGDEAAKLWTDGAIFVDVYPHAPKPPNLPAGTIWREPQHFTIENAKWLPNIGYGKLAPETETYFTRHLEALTSGDKAKAIVFFCVRNCWMSWNAAKRAMTYGYSNVIWFSEGTDAWQEIGQPIEEAKPLP